MKHGKKYREAVQKVDAEKAYDIPEACALILHSAGLCAAQCSVFALDMGRPVAIRELAEQMIRLSGKRPGILSSLGHSGSSLPWGFVPVLS